MERTFFVVPSLQGARLALEELFARSGHITTEARCAVVIDVYAHDGTLIQRAISHAQVSARVKKLFTETIDRHVTRFAEEQLLDAIPRRGGDPYRGGAIPTNDVHGFDVAFAGEVARRRARTLRDSLKSAADLDVRLYAVPFFVYERREKTDTDTAVILRGADGAYVYEETTESLRD